MKTLQHSESVEVEVIRLLQATLAPAAGSAFKAGEYLARDVDPAVYSSASEFARVYSFYSFLKKWKGLKVPGINPTQAALATWIESEKLCFQTNRRLHMEAATGSYSVAPAALMRAQRKVASILGPVNMERIAELCRFGNGATFDLKRGATHAEKSRRPTVTFDAIPVVCQILSGDRYMGSLVGPFRNLKIVRANRMVMVPKSAKTHRPIAAEPTLNSYVQQGIGRYIRERLLRAGVNLGDQTINQDYARRAQAEGFSTLDLSSASDTLCVNLVKLLLPREWWELLSSVRSPNTQFKGRVYHLSKFSSMGNAYTFELESMIFYALLAAVSEHDVSVYGDDLIVRHSDEARAREILAWAGFKVNSEKSFGAGSRFYESCGKHYFDGTEVTPVYQKDVCKRPHDYVRLHNRLIRAGIRLNLREEFKPAAAHVRKRAVQQFGRSSPGVGPLVEYDEYFIKEDYVWSGPYVDRVQIRSAVTVSKVRKHDERYVHVAYFGRKLRNPSFQNPDPQGQCSDSGGSKLLVVEKYHWRSSTLS